MIDLHSDSRHLFLASAFYINLACGVAAQEGGARVPEIGPHKRLGRFCPILFPWESCFIYPCWLEL